MHRLCAASLVALSLVATASVAEPMPQRLAGNWRITRILPTHNVGCWATDDARPLVGTTLTYAPDSLRWHGGQIEVSDIATRIVTAVQFSKETGADGTGASFAQLGIHAPSVLEVDFQHEDADITGATTEVPGDSVLLAGPNRIIVSACGVYFEATRTSGLQRASLKDR